MDLSCGCEIVDLDETKSHLKLVCAGVFLPGRHEPDPSVIQIASDKDAWVFFPSALADVFYLVNAVFPVGNLNSLAIVGSFHLHDFNLHLKAP